MRKKMLFACLLLVAAMVISIAGGCLVLRAFALGALVSVHDMTVAAILWMGGTGIAVVAVLLLVFYLVHTLNQKVSNIENTAQIKNSRKEDVT